MKKIRKKHEQSIIDGFSNRFKVNALARGRSVTKCSLDGQDVELGSDYLFTDSSRFMLVEFKFEVDGLKTEGTKHRRKKMCLKLDADSEIRARSLRCHYIAWTVKNGARTMSFNQYYPEICNKDIFGPDVNLLKNSANKTSRLSADSIMNDFLDQSLGDNFYSFKSYVQWLKMIEEDNDPIELLLDNPDSHQLEFLEFNSLVDLKTWLERQNFKPKPPRLTF
ncbi:hypothetical protein [Duganella sp. P38]|uniref:hypothetical protein n=1 Tax=Duganella sp. P38 TaxID=3423949 RepID=UPI003D7A8B1B